MAQTEATPADQRNVKDEAVRSLPWTILNFTGQRGVTFLSTLVLAHLLRPADFGVIALASTVIFALSLLRDMGLGNTLILRQDLDRTQQGTVLTLMVVFAVVVAILTAALAPVAALFFHQRRLTDVLLALTPLIVVGGLTGFYDLVLQREFLFRRRFYAYLIQAGLYAAIAIPMAFAGFGVWSVVVGQVLSNFVLAGVLTVMAGPFRVRPAFSGAAARDVMRSGRAFLALGLLDFFQQNTDYVSVGRFVSAAQVSFYYSAYRIAELLTALIADAISRITFSTFSRMRAQGRDVIPSFLTVVRLVMMLACPLGLILSGVASPFVRLTYGHQWVGMIPVLGIMGLWATVRPLDITLNWLLNSTGHPGAPARVGTVTYAVLLPAVVSAAAFSGIIAVAWVMLTYNVIQTIALAVFIRIRLGVGLRRLWAAVQPIAIAGPFAWLASRGVSDAIHVPVLALPLAVLAGVAAYAVALTAAERAIIPWAVRTMREAVRGARAPVTAAADPG